MPVTTTSSASWTTLPTFPSCSVDRETQDTVRETTLMSQLAAASAAAF